MKTILVTGGTVFLSRYIAEYFVRKGDEVYVLNRNTKKQSTGVQLIEADRHALQTQLKKIHFDVVIDVTAYDEKDINDLLDGLGSFYEYIMISSSAVYPEYGRQPFHENDALALNKFWGTYGTDKIKAENALLKRCPNAYIIRPPYLYGPYNNVYREAFVFDCAKMNRPFYLPKQGKMKLQFFHVRDLCCFLDEILEKKPNDHIFNVGNEELITVKEWVTLCYHILGQEPIFIDMDSSINQREYFSFYDYEYCLDVSRQKQLLPSLTSLKEGLIECWNWYQDHEEQVNKKPFFAHIDRLLVEMKRKKGDEQNENE